MMKAIPVSAWMRLLKKASLPENRTTGTAQLPPGLHTTAAPVLHPLFFLIKIEYLCAAQAFFAKRIETAVVHRKPHCFALWFKLVRQGGIGFL